MIPSLSGGMLPVKSRISRRPNLLDDDSADVPAGMLAATVLSLGAKSRLRAFGAGLGEADMDFDSGRGQGRKAGGRRVPPPEK